MLKVETVKTRLQVSGEGLGLVVRNTLKNEGVGSFWKGIVWAWGREGSYASIKLGGYAPVRDALGASGKDGKLKLGLDRDSLGLKEIHISFASVLRQLPSI